jgi:hypothetical protein
MKFVRKVANSDILADIIDIPDELRSKKIEIIILPYENMDSVDLKGQKKKSIRGALAKYKNIELQEKENEAWVNAAVKKHENN